MTRPCTPPPPPDESRGEVHAYVDDGEELPAIAREYEARGLAVAGWADAKIGGMGPTLEATTWRP